LLDVTLDIIPLGPHHYLVLFEENVQAAPVAPRPKRSTRSAGSRKEDQSEVQRLQRELAASRDYLQSMIQDLEAANEELQSANEEILSSNEELQSTNEELDTAKEELQSTNEELNTLNEELQSRNEELSRVNSDLLNLLSSIQVAIVIVSSDLRIRRFTPMAERLLNLIPGDIGRPIMQIKPNFDCPDLQVRIGEVIDHISVHQQEVQDASGKRFSLVIRPYKDIDNRIDGAVLSLFEIEDGRHNQAQVERARDVAQAAAASVREPLLVLDDQLRIEVANPAFCERFELTAEACRGRGLAELFDGRWNDPQLRRQLESVLQDGRDLEHFVNSADGQPGQRALRIDARQAPSSRGRLLVVTIREKE
jgi:two-component system CheB/CheR fusion protein